MIANSLRDAPAIPALMDVTMPVITRMGQMVAVLGEGWDTPHDRHDLLRAAIGHAVDFHAWRSLARVQGLTDAQAVELMIGMVRTAQNGHDIAISSRYTHA
jgi:hypothetical protein